MASSSSAIRVTGTPLYLGQRTSNILAVVDAALHCTRHDPFAQERMTMLTGILHGGIHSLKQCLLFILNSFVSWYRCTGIENIKRDKTLVSR